MVNIDKAFGGDKRLAKLIEEAQSAAILKALDEDGVSLEDSDELRKRSLAARDEILNAYREWVAAGSPEEKTT